MTRDCVGSGKSHHSESNGGIERKNRTVEEKNQTGCMRTTVHIGHRPYQSFNGNSTPKFTEGLETGHHITSC
jgi:hypothetical protein